MWQLLYPSFLGVILSFLKPIDDNFVGSFSLPISLGISWSRVPVRDPYFGAVFFESPAIELEPVVRDKGSRDPKSCNNISLDESFSIYISDVS